MPEGPNFNQTLTNLSSQFPGAVSSTPPPAPQSISNEIQTLLANPLAVGEKIATTSAAGDIADAKILANRANTEAFSNTKDFKLATMLVGTVTTLIASAAGAILDRAVSIGYLRNMIEQSLGTWALYNNQTLENSTGSNCYGYGKFAGQFNTVLDGFQSGQYNSGSNSFFRGYWCGQFNSGSNASGYGSLSMRYNGGSNNSGYGYSSLARTTGDGNSALGYASWNTSIDSPDAQTFTQAAINLGTNTITVASTVNIGTIGKRYCMRFTTVSGTAPTGLTTGADYSVLVVSATQLQLLDGIMSAVGSGSFSLTPYIGRAFTNTTTVGQGSIPTKSNQVVLGNPATAELLTSATACITGLLPQRASKAAADVDTTIVAGQWYRITGTDVICQKG
jgi:hypothetical protein